MLVQETIWLGDTPIETIRPKTGGFEFFYVHTDHLNTPRRVSRPLDNQLRWRWDADPFGTAVPNENPAALGAFKYNLRYPGQYFDVESGLNYNYFRDYDSATGKYVESDPIGLKGGINTYIYAAQNPLRYIDKTGQNPAVAVLAFCARFPAMCIATAAALEEALRKAMNAAINYCQNRDEEGYRNCVSDCSATAVTDNERCGINFANDPVGYRLCAAGVLARMNICIAGCASKFGIN